MVIIKPVNSKGERVTNWGSNNNTPSGGGAGRATIDPDYIVSGGGQVAVRGTIGDNVILQDQTSRQTSSASGSGVASATTTPQGVSEETKALFQGKERVPVSPGFAGKLTGQSVRDDRNYYANVSRSNRNKQSVDDSPQTEPRTFKQKLKNTGKQISEPFVSGFKYAFGKTSGAESYRDYETPSEREARIREDTTGKEVFANVLIMGGSGAAARPSVVKQGEVTFASRSTVQNIADESGIVQGSSRIEGYGSTKKKIFGITVKEKPFKITGTAKETAKPIDVEIFGLQSADDVFSTKGASKLKITYGDGRVNTVSSTSKGFQVAGAGKRQVTQSVSGSQGLRQQPGEVFDEVYVVNSQVGGSQGSVVSKRGGGVFTSKDTEPIVLTRPGGDVYFNPETGLESATSTLRFKPDEQMSITYSKVNQAFTSKAPLSAEYTYEAAGGRLRQNLKPFAEVTSRDVVPSGGVNSVAGEQVLSQSKFAPSVAGNFNVAGAVQSAVSVSAPVRAKLPVPVGVYGKASQNVSAVTRGETKASSVFSSDVVVSQKTSSVALPVQSGASSSRVGQSMFPALSRSVGVGRSGVSESNSATDLSKDVSAAVLPESLAKAGVVQKQSQSVVSRSRFSSSNSFSGRGVGSSARTSFMVPAGIKLPMRGGSGEFGVSVRRGGVFRSVGGGLSLRDALRRGQGVVRGSAAASFMVTRGGRVVNVLAPSGFYSKKGVLIERNKFRINTPGELKEISSVGVSKKRKRGVLG